VGVAPLEGDADHSTGRELTVDAPTGVVFPPSAPSSGDGAEVSRSTSALGRAVVADALRGIDPIGARAAENETNWRRGYVGHFRRLVEAGLTSADAGRTIASDGLASLYRRMRYIGRDGVEIGIADVFAGDGASRAAEGAAGITTVTVAGNGEIDRELSVPYHGIRLRGADLQRQLDTWTDGGVIEPSAADAVRAVAANPDWLDLADQRIVALGAGAEMGPVQALLRWGAGVVAVDLPRPGIWSRLLEINGRYGGRLHLPVRGVATADDPQLPERAGVDLLHDLTDVAAWLGDVEGRLVLGNYVYADGPVNVRVCMAVDALCADVVSRRSDTALAFLATPTDVFAVPVEAVAYAGEAYRRSTAIKRVRQPIRVLSAGRLLRRNYAPGADPGICDSLVPQQGPNYALAKRLQRWRAAVARSAGTAVSFKVAPPTRTRSVVKNRALAAAYAGAHLFDVEVFEPATSNTLMAAMLVHDLRSPAPAAAHTWQDEAYGAAHGGLWRGPYAPRSALGLAAMIGFGGARA
jgi:hypothetical protein